MATNGIYESVGDVVVPNGIAPGGAFTVRVNGIRNRQKTAVSKQLFRASGYAPIIVPPSVERAEGPRHAQRPSAIARATLHSRTACSLDAVPYKPCSVATWVSQQQLPFEAHAEDVGWLAGPVNGTSGRPMPAFTGPAYGVRNKRLTARSSARTIMRSAQFTHQFRQLCVQQAQQHAAAWSESHHPPDGIERAWRAADLRGEHVELWYAACVRLAALNPALPASQLWDPSTRLYDRELDAALPFGCWQWLNRHLSFGQYGQSAAVDDDSAGTGESGDVEQPYAKFQKRRASSNVARAAPPRLFNPDQHCGFDDLCRSTRHLDGNRTRHKAAVHTAAAVDGLNCARSHYFMYWEEHGWEQRIEAAEVGGGESDAAGGAGAPAGGMGARPAESGHTGTSEQSAAAAAGSAARGSSRRGSRGQGACSTARGQGRGGSQQAVRQPTGCERGGIDDSTAGGDESNPDPQSPASGPTSIDSRLGRARAVLPPHVGHCLWLDRGMSDMKAMLSTRAAGYHVTGMMQANRIGLPRRYLAQLKSEMACPPKCAHRAASQGCKRWSWTCLHKGEWELQIWNDGSDLVIGLSSCASATRLVPLARTVNNEIRVPLSPESIGLYTWFGRSPTDCGDQQRKRLSLAVRRRLRQGPKGALFDAEIGFVNGTVVASLLRSLVGQFTLWDFCDEFAREVIGAVSMRRRTTAEQAHAALNSPPAAVASQTRTAHASHVPVSFALERKRCRAAGETVLPPAKRGSECCRSDCALGEPKRPSWYCHGCHIANSNGWYHWGCYWKCHQVQVK